MTSSLVGSEMCIRDSPNRVRIIRCCTARSTTTAPPHTARHALLPVSYTHMTLPTSVDLGGR
eukprot:3770226-Prorocentrum_lima.AAC.1